MLVSRTGFDAAGQPIKNAADASAPGDVPNFAQVQAFVRGRAFKDPVRVASTANISVTSAPSSVDGITLANGEGLLLKNQTDATQNGPYVFNGAGNALTRRADADTAAKLVGAVVGVLEGTANADTRWLQRVDQITLGTTGLVFIQDIGGGAAYSNGDGLNLSGTTFSVKPKTGGGISVTVDGVAIDGSVVQRRVAATIGDGTATTFTITHNLGHKDVTVIVRDLSDDSFPWCDPKAPTINTVTVAFGIAPAASSYRVVISG